MYYRGWDINYWPIGSQHWRATQHGVEICTNSVAGLQRMIDARIVERKQEKMHGTRNL